MSGWVVAGRFQVNHDGVVYAPGDPLPDLPAHLAEKWQAAGWIEPDDVAPPAKTV